MQPPEPQLLRDGARALGVVLDAAAVRRLLDYLALLVKWNRIYNLTAVRDPSRMLAQHLLDSLAIVQPLRRWTRGKPARVLDVGSGAGLPGVVLALLCPELDVTCVDAVGKKAAFVRQVGSELAIANLHAIHARIEDLPHDPVEAIVSRAFASLADFVMLTRPHADEATVWLAMKGQRPSDEIGALPADIEVFHVEHLEVPGLDAERCIVWMRTRP